MNYKSELNTEPIRAELENDSRLLLHMLTDFARCQRSADAPPTFRTDEPFSTTFPSRHFAREGFNFRSALWQKTQVDLILFNPRRPIIAVVYQDYGTYTLGIYALTGRERAEMGNQLYFYSGPQMSDDSDFNPAQYKMSISWSPEGTKLLCVQSDLACKDSAEIKIFALEESGRTRRIQTPGMPSINLRRIQGKPPAECWSSDDTFWIPAEDEYHNLTKVTVFDDAVVIISMRDDPVLERACRAPISGIWINDSTVFWTQKCRERAHSEHTLIRRQSLDSPRAFPNRRALALTSGIVTCGTLSTSGDNSLLLLAIYPDGLQFEADELDADVEIVEEVDDSTWQHASNSTYMYGASCTLPMPWLTGKNTRNHRMSLLIVSCFDDDIKTVTCVHGVKSTRSFYSNPAGIVNEYNFVGQTERYVLVRHDKNEENDYYLLSKITNMWMPVCKSKVFTPNVDASLIIRHNLWSNHSGTIIRRGAGHPLKASMSFDASPNAREKIKQWHQECDFGPLRATDSNWCSHLHYGKEIGEPNCRECKKLLAWRQQEEYNRPKFLPTHVVFSARY